MGEMVEFASNGHDARGHLALPDSGSGPAVLVIQEWWGLNPIMKGVADFLAAQGFVALAPDLYHGELAGHDEMDKAGQLMTDLPPDRAARDIGFLRLLRTSLQVRCLSRLPVARRRRRPQ